MKVIVAADDFGLTRTNTDTILEVVDAGAVEQISILANGNAVEYALAAYETRKDRVLLNLHVNLTEGPSLCGHTKVPLLTEPDGQFTYSVAGLGIAYTFSSSVRRTAFREQIANEVRAQRARIGEGSIPMRVDGHQHVHMLPFVFDTILDSGPLSYIRISREPWYAWDISSLLRSIPRLPAFFALQWCAVRNRRVVEHRRIAHPDAFIGVLYSGNMSYESSAAGLAQVSPRSTTVELLLHPGQACSHEELSPWKGRADLAWHIDAARAHERAVVLSEPFKQLIARGKTMSATVGFSPWMLIRYGISGVASAASNLILLYVLTDWFQVWYLWAAVAGFIASMIVSYVLQKFWTFTDREHAVSTTQQLIAYFILDVLNLCLNIAILYVLVTVFGVWYLLANFITLAVLAIESYYVLNHLIFASPKTPSV